jgi:predicted O-linked N-acetylglucosamine transferase (SPINDLY family)
VIPSSKRSHYSENPVYLPDCYQATDDRRPFPEKASRVQLGLPDQALVCCSLNNSYKYNADMLDIWARLIRKVPGSVLWLIADDPLTEANLRREAGLRGLDSDRLVLSGRVSYEDHLRRLTCADLFLDTFPFNAGATAGDVLWAGVPLLTCAGDAFASRMAGSLLRAAALPELITFSLEEYEQRALELITTPARLQELRQRTEAARGNSALFQTERYCRNLESAFELMWQRSQRGERPSPITVGSGSVSP